MIPTRFGTLGFATPIYSEGFVKKQNTVYSENESATLPLNPTYVLERQLKKRKPKQRTGLDICGGTFLTHPT